MADADYEVIRRHLPKVLSSEQLEKSETSQKLLRYLAERAVRRDPPKETEIAIDVFGRDASFNSAEESLVRVGMRALRRRLRDYYAEAGQDDEFQFVIPKGRISPQLRAARSRACAGRDCLTRDGRPGCTHPRHPRGRGSCP